MMDIFPANILVLLYDISCAIATIATNRDDTDIRVWICPSEIIQFIKSFRASSACGCPKI